MGTLYHIWHMCRYANYDNSIVIRMNLSQIYSYMPLGEAKQVLVTIQSEEVIINLCWKGGIHQLAKIYLSEIKSIYNMSKCMSTNYN